MVQAKSQGMMVLVFCVVFLKPVGCGRFKHFLKEKDGLEIRCG